MFMIGHEEEVSANRKENERGTKESNRIIVRMEEQVPRTKMKCDLGQSTAFSNLER